MLNELSTFYWEAARAEKGYDVIFVDEMHLFNAQERLIFHHLLADGNKAPLVVMALDPKQSPREVFTDVTDERDTKPVSIYQRARLPNSTQIDLEDVYRYTPEIERLIRVVIDAVPGLTLGDDWDVPRGRSVIESGPTPSMAIVATKNEMFRVSVTLAKDSVRNARSRGGRVAILCLDDERFSEYAPAATGQHPKDIIVLKSRDDTEKLRYAHRKIVFSTPEYVAGQQFDTVVLADVNRNQVPLGNFVGHQLRRFLSELYLGLSRAEYRLIILASRDAGGPPPYLETAQKNGVLVERAIPRG
jgi:hypothetical protein